MNGNISEMAGRKRPDLSKLRPAYVIRRAKESIKDAPRRAKGQMFTPAPEED